MIKPTLTILVGNIGNGKSTLCKKLAKNHIIISRDSIRYMIGGGKYRFDLTLEPFVAKCTEKCIESFMLSRKDIVVDETNVLKRTRSRYLRLAKKYNYNSKAIILKKLSKEESVRRRMKAPHDRASKKLWNYIWEMFEKLYQEPSKQEGFKEIIKL